MLPLFGRDACDSGGRAQGYDAPIEIVRAELRVSKADAHPHASVPFVHSGEEGQDELGELGVEADRCADYLVFDRCYRDVQAWGVRYPFPHHTPVPQGVAQ